MTNRPKQIGTAAESAVVKALRAHGFPHAERRALSGAADHGDILLCPGVIAEVKGGAAAKDASDGLLQVWWEETQREKINARADVALLIVARRGIGPANADRWWAVMPLDQLRQMLGAWDPVPTGTGLVRLHLRDAAILLRAYGYGEALT